MAAAASETRPFTARAVLTGVVLSTCLACGGVLNVAAGRIRPCLALGVAR